MVGLSERQKSGRIVDHFLYLAIENSARQKLAELLTAFLIRQNRVPIANGKYIGTLCFGYWHSIFLIRKAVRKLFELGKR